MKTWIWAVISVVAAFLFGYWIGTRGGEVVETTRVDTVFFEKPSPINTSDIGVSVNVPKLVFARDTVDRIVVVGDSVRMEVTERTLEYRDSTYYARVVGPVVGPLVPRLDFIETYNKTVTRTVTKKPRFAVTAGAGVGWTPKGIQPVVGLHAGVILWSK